MGTIALLMIHNCMSYLGYANSEEMRKAAEDNDKINQSSIEAYKSVCNLTEDEIKEKMNAETWLTAQECLDFGFATEIADQEEEDEETQQTAFGMIRQAVLGAQHGMLSVTIKTVSTYNYLYFPDDGSNTKKLAGNQQFMASGAESASDRIMELCIGHLTEEF